jgi:NADPH:quinone reductase-like Zn-dependent oxidoreductase
VKAAVLRELGAPTFEDNYTDAEAGPDQVVVDVEVASLNPIDVTKASGKFMTGPPALPSVPGDEGVGRTADGTRVYFGTAAQPFGSMAERTVVKSADLVPIPDGIDSATAAAVGNPGIAAMLALKNKAALQSGETVLILGATGAVGRLGTQVAKALGAGRVIAAGRDDAALATLELLGADATVNVSDEAGLADAILAASEGGVDVVVDLLWGHTALAALKAGKPGIRLVQIGQSAGAEVSLPAAVVRGKRATLLGHANASTPFPARAAAYLELLELVAAGTLTVDFDTLPLTDVAEAWARQAKPGHRKTVLDVQR